MCGFGKFCKVFMSPHLLGKVLCLWQNFVVKNIVCPEVKLISFLGHALHNRKEFLTIRAAPFAIKFPFYRILFARFFFFRHIRSCQLAEKVAYQQSSPTVWVLFCSFWHGVPLEISYGSKEQGRYVTRIKQVWCNTHFQIVHVLKLKAVWLRNIVIIASGHAKL